jgi:hypothetical protein
MRSDVKSAARLLILPTVAFATVLAFMPGRAGLALRIYGLIVSVAVLGCALRALVRAFPPSTPLRKASGRSERGSAAPETLERIEQEAILGVAGAFELHHRLRPRLRDLAAGLLATRRRLSLDKDPEGARAVLGEDTWELVRPDRPPPEDRLARGLPAARLRAVVESLERT